AQFSPDGRFVAYVSDESGRAEVYVQSFPASGGKWQISTGGGDQPQWRRDGGELFYMAPDKKLMAVPIAPGNEFAPGSPVALFAARSAHDLARRRLCQRAHQSSLEPGRQRRLVS